MGRIGEIKESELDLNDFSEMVEMLKTFDTDFLVEIGTSLARSQNANIRTKVTELGIVDKTRELDQPLQQGLNKEENTIMSSNSFNQNLLSAAVLFLILACILDL